MTDPTIIMTGAIVVLAVFFPGFLWLVVHGARIKAERLDREGVDG